MLTVAKGGDGQAEALVGSAVDTVGTGVGTKLEGIFQMSSKGTLDGLPPFVLSLQERIGGEHILRPGVYRAMSMTKTDIELAVEKSRASKLDLVNQVSKA